MKVPRVRIDVAFKIVLFVCTLTMIAALSALVTYVAAEQAVEYQGDKFVGAGLAVAGSTIGAGIALYGTVGSGFPAIVEKPELITWLLLMAGLSEGIAIYGLLIGIMVLGA